MAFYLLGTLMGGEPACSARGAAAIQRGLTARGRALGVSPWAQEDLLCHAEPIIRGFLLDAACHLFVRTRSVDQFSMAVMKVQPRTLWPRRADDHCCLWRSNRGDWPARVERAGFGPHGRRLCGPQPCPQRIGLGLGRCVWMPSGRTGPCVGPV